MVDGKHADVVVACLAGFGTWGATVEVKIGDAMTAAANANAAAITAPRIAAKVGANTYASELFGANHGELSHPAGREPMVVLTIPGNAATDNPATPANETLLGVQHEGSATVEFTLSGGAMFAANVTGLLWDSDISADGNDNDGDENGTPGDALGDDGNAETGVKDNDFATAPGTVASIVSGGRKGESSITIKIEPASTEADDTNRRRNYTAGTAAGGQAIAFRLPKLSNLDSLAGHDGGAKAKSIAIHAEATIISGAFSDGSLTGLTGATAVQSRDSLTVDVTDGTTMMIGLVDAGDNEAFQYVKGANKDGYLKLGTVTIETKQVAIAAKAAVPQRVHYYIDTEEYSAAQIAGRAALDRDDVVFTPSAAAAPAVAYTIYDLDGDNIDEGLRGTLTVNAMGTRGLFNDGDMLFVDYDGDGKLGGGEEVSVDSDMPGMAMGSALSIDPDKSDSFNAAGTGTFAVYYMPGGKGVINHGAMITLSANVNYSDPTARDEAPATSTTMLHFDGVNSEVMAYAIPHSTNGTGDKANVRVRCEASAGCRVFLECWDDMGMRSFGKAGTIEGNALVKWDATAIEGVIGVEDPASRLSCRILSAGMVSVQQLTRDGNSKTLVNNTYVAQ